MRSVWSFFCVCASLLLISLWRSGDGRLRSTLLYLLLGIPLTHILLSCACIECRLCCMWRSYIYIHALMKGHICLCTQEVITGNGALTIPWKRAAKRVKITHVISLLLLSFPLMMYFFLWLCIFLHHSSSYQNDSLLPLLVRRREVCHVVIQLEQSHCLFGPARSH